MNTKNSKADRIGPGVKRKKSSQPETAVDAHKVEEKMP